MRLITCWSAQNSSGRHAGISGTVGNPAPSRDFNAIIYSVFISLFTWYRLSNLLTPTSIISLVWDSTLWTEKNKFWVTNLAADLFAADFFLIYQYIFV